MKKTLLLFGFLFITAVQAQFTVTKHYGTAITNGQVFTYTTLDYAEASLGFFVHNNTTSDINIRIECVEITNGTGAGMELCFGDVCLSSVSAGYYYPSHPVTIAPNGTNSEFDHFYNTNPGDGQNPIEYKFRFFQVDSQGDEIGDSLMITYRYAGTLGIDGFDFSNELGAVGVMLKSTLIGNDLDIKTLKNVQAVMYDINGHLISNQALNAGNHSINTANLSSGVYIMQFKNEQGQSGSARFIKK